MSPSALLLLTRLYQASGRCIFPVVYAFLCVRFIYFVHQCHRFLHVHRSAIDATLDTGGWLNLTRQGLSPCKRRQASLGALTISSPNSGRMTSNRCKQDKLSKLVAFPLVRFRVESAVTRQSPHGSVLEDFPHTVLR